MTRARAEKVTADPAAARRLLDQARRHMTSARADGVDAESAYGLTYQAALKAMIAVLTADGVRVTSGAGGHMVTLRETGTRLELDSSSLKRVDRMRRTRRTVFYDAGEISTQELAQALSDAATVLAAAERFIEARLDR